MSARKYTDGDKSIDGRGSANSRAYWLQRAYNCLLFLSICVVFACSLCWLTIPPGLELNWVAVSILFATRFITNAFILMEAVCKQQQHANFLKALQAIEASLRLRLKWRVESTTLLSQIKRMLKYHLIRARYGAIHGGHLGICRLWRLLLAGTVVYMQHTCTHTATARLFAHIAALLA